MKENCIVNYKEGKILKVNSPKGGESKLFNSIAKLPFMESLEQALEAYKSVVSSEEINLIFETDSGRTSSYKEALELAKGKDIEVKVGETVLATVSSNTNPSTKLGLVNNLINEGLIKENREVNQGESFLVLDGNSAERSIANGEATKQFARENGFRPLVSTNGEVVIEDTTAPQIDPLLDKIDSLISGFLYSKEGGEILKTEEGLKGAMLNFLNKIGFSITSLERYEQVYLEKNGELPNSQALVDFANKVVALKDGTIDLNTLGEEFSHIILELLPQDQLTDLLRNVHNTQEWADFSEQYMETYKDEAMVRKEILGKVLANNLQGNEASMNMFERLLELIRGFLNNIFNKDQETFRKQLNTLTKDVQNLLLQEELQEGLDLDSLANKKFRMYRLDNSREALDLHRSVQEIERVLAKGRGTSSELRELGDKLEATNSEQALHKLISIANRQVDYIKSATDEATKRGDVLNVEEGIVLANLKGVVSPILSKLLPSLKGDVKATSEVEKALLNIAKISADQSDKVVERVVDRLSANLTSGETITIDGTEMEAEAYIRHKVETAIADTNFMFRNFGQLTHSKDPLLNILGKLIGNMTKKSHNNYYTSAKDFQAYMRDNNIKAKDITKFYKGNGMITSLWNFSAYDDVLMQGQAEIYHKHDNTKTVKEWKEFIKNPKNVRPNLPEAWKEINDFAMTLQERPMESEYYKEREEDLEALNISQTTKDRLKQLSQRRGDIMANTDTKGGYPSYSRTTRMQLDNYNLERRALKSFYDIDGIMKDGLKVVPKDIYESADISLDVGEVITKDWMLIGNYYVALLEGASEEAVLAYEVSKVDDALLQKSIKTGTLKTNQKLSDEFIKILKEVELNEGRESAKEYFLLNTNIGYSDEYWESVDFGTRQEELLEHFTSVKSSDEFRQNYLNFLTFSQERKEILKQYQDSKDATNTMAQHMSPETKRILRSLTEDMDFARRQMSKELPSEFVSSDATERIPNTSYLGELEDMGILNDMGARAAFARGHLTSGAISQIEALEAAIWEKYHGKEVSEGMSERLEQEVGDSVGQEAIVKLYENRLPIYYTSNSPVGLRENMERLDNSSDSITDIVQSIADLGSVRMGNHVSFYESVLSDRANPNYQNKFLGGRVQPKLSDERFVDKDFVSRFNPMKDANGNFVFDEKGMPIAQSNLKDYEVYKKMLDFYAEGVEAMGELYTHNIYQAPQISSTSMERIQKIISDKGIMNTATEWYKDLVSFRVDDMVEGEENLQGEALLDSGQRTIPKLYVRRKEDMSDTSSDLFYSLNVFNQQAYLHKARKEATNEMLALEDKIKNRKYVGNKGGEATNTYKMAKSYIDYNIFGQKENRNYKVSIPVLGDIDLARIGSVLHKYLRNNNLAYNLVIPATSWATAEASLLIERLTGQYIDGDSMSYATSEFRKLMGGAIKETMALDSTSKLVVIGEHLGVFEYLSRIENSKYSTALRTLSKASYGAHTTGNFSPLSKSMLSSLIGHRLYGGNFIDFRTFKRIKKKEGITDDRQIKGDWNAMRGDSFYTFMGVKDGKVNMDYERLESLGIDLNKAKEIESSSIDKIKKIVEAVDGNIREEERTILQRDFLGRFLTTHKGWLAISLARRLKSKHYSLQTETFEEGSYLTLMRKIRDTFGELVESKKTWAEKKKVIRDMYVEADEFERINLKRVIVDLGIVSALYLLVSSLSAFADDEENRDIYAVQLSTYLMERLLNETKSSQIGIFGEIASTVEDPVVGFKQTLDRFKVWEAFNTDVSPTGQYAGVPKNYKYLMSMIPGMKSAYTISGAETIYRQRQTYKFFQSPEEMQPLALFLSTEEIKELYN